MPSIPSDVLIAVKVSLFTPSRKGLSLVSFNHISGIMMYDITDRPTGLKSIKPAEFFK